MYVSDTPHLGYTPPLMETAPPQDRQTIIKDFVSEMLGSLSEGFLNAFNAEDDEDEDSTPLTLMTNTALGSLLLEGGGFQPLVDQIEKGLILKEAQDLYRAQASIHGV